MGWEVDFCAGFRFIFTALAATEFLGANRTDDVIYSVLPFYKAENIATSIGPAIVNGVPAVVKKDFSAEDYFRDCALHRCTVRRLIMKGHFTF